jgi:hypothetical protein
LRLVFSPSSRRLQARRQTGSSRQLRGVASSLMIDGAFSFGGRRHEDQPEPRFVEGSKVAAIGWHWSSRIVPYAICSIQTLPRAVAACRGIYCPSASPHPVESTNEPWGCRMAVVGAVDMASNCVVLRDVVDGPIRRSDAAAALQAPGASN